MPRPLISTMHRQRPVHAQLGMIAERWQIDVGFSDDLQNILLAIGQNTLSINIQKLFLIHNSLRQWHLDGTPRSTIRT